MGAHLLATRIRIRQRVVNIGVCSPRHWFGVPPSNHRHRRVYLALLRAGFTGTVWQFVYAGQEAGLIMPIAGNKHELHVRFYKDRIDAELEVGRRYVGHFTSRRLPGGGLLRRILHQRLGAQQFARIVDAIPAEGAEEVDVGWMTETRTVVPFVGLLSWTVAVFAILSLLESVFIAVCLLGLAILIGVERSLPSTPWLKS